MDRVFNDFKWTVLNGVVQQSIESAIPLLLTFIDANFVTEWVLLDADETVCFIQRVKLLFGLFIEDPDCQRAFYEQTETVSAENEATLMIDGLATDFVQILKRLFPNEDVQLISTEQKVPSETLTLFNALYDQNHLKPDDDENATGTAKTCMYHLLVVARRRKWRRTRRRRKAIGAILSALLSRQI